MNVQVGQGGLSAYPHRKRRKKQNKEKYINSTLFHIAELFYKRKVKHP